MKRVAIIGAGPAGLSQLVAFHHQKDDVDDVEIVCYERQADLGGQWNCHHFTGDASTAKHQQARHSCMYRGLWSNGPKECIEYPDYSFEEHFGGRQIAGSFPPRDVIADYVKGRFSNKRLPGLLDKIQFQTNVRNVTFENDVFAVTVEDLRSHQVSSREFDYVVVATGRFSTPNVPHFKGIDTFKGRVLHSRDFSDAREFQGQSVLVVGASDSAEDIALQCHKFGARLVTMCYRSTPLDYDWPTGIKEVPLLTHIKGNTVFFRDKSRLKNVDAIILCTGYLYDFPFLSDDLRLKATSNRLCPKNLYQGIFWSPNPRLAYLGMQNQYFTFTSFDAQAWYVRDVILGRITLPDYETRMVHINEQRSREDELETDAEEILFEGEYVRSMLEATDYPSLDIDGVVCTFLQYEEHRCEDIVTYRDRTYRSLVTGTMTPKHHTPWIECMDDRTESFLNPLNDSEHKEDVT